MNSLFQILAAVLAAVSCSFIQNSSNQIQSALNSTFFTASERFFKPIYIPNIMSYSDDSKISKTKVPVITKEMILKNSLQSKEISQESKVRENYSDENPKTSANPLKFSARYSTKQKDPSKERTSRSKETEKPREDEKKIGDSSGISGTLDLLESNDVSSTEKYKSFSDRSDELKDNEEESDELIEIGATTSELYSKLPTPTPFRKYSDEDYDKYVTTSAETEETNDSEEAEKNDEEIKSSDEDYYNSDSKNYHSIQTPLEEIKYRGHHSSKDDFKPEKVRTRLLDTISRRPATHNWPYSRSQIEGELEKLNEVSDGDENYEKILDEGVKEEVKKGPKQSGLELAIEKDEFKFDRNKKYSQIDERNRLKQQQKSLSVEEEKDDKLPLFQSLKHHQVDENEAKYQPKMHIKEEGIWSTKKTLSTTARNIFKVKTPPRRQPKQYNISQELTPNFRKHHFLGPIVFNHTLEQKTIRTKTKPFTKAQKQSSTFLKGLSNNKKFDQDKLTNQKIQSIFEDESKEILHFNHLEENEEMYNAILANIKSVFGVGIQSGKSSVHSKSQQKEPVPEIKLDESKSFTWSLPLIKREQIN